MQIGDDLDYETEASEFQKKVDSETEKFGATSYITDQTGKFNQL